jgi:hypothetical protein
VGTQQDAKLSRQKQSGIAGEAKQQTANSKQQTANSSKQEPDGARTPTVWPLTFLP